MSVDAKQPPQPQADPMVGVRIGDDYVIQRVLGRGGMGVVYEAEDTALGIPVALKSIEKTLALDATFVRRFRTEARAMARIASPHIVSVKALRETPHGLFIVMEYVDGGNLHDAMSRGAIPWPDLWPMLRQMLLGLEAAHAVGVVHRDIKPRNVLLTKDGTIKLTDFGLARFQTDGEATVTQAVAGTLSYMSPEQIRSLPNLDGRSDLFSLALTAYEALAGQLPFDRSAGEFSVMRSIVEDPFPPPTNFQDIPEPVAAVLMKALEKDPAHRYQTAEEFREALAAAGDDLAPTQTRVPPVPRPEADPEVLSTAAVESGKAPKRKDPFRISPTLIAGLVGLLAIIAALLWWTKPGTIVPVASGGVSYFINDEPFEAEMQFPAGPVTVRCLAGGLSATADIDVKRGATRRVECFPHDQSVDISAFWDGEPADATVSVDGKEPMPAAGRLTLATGRHTIRVVSSTITKLDSTVTLEVRPSFDPETPAPLLVAIRGGNDPEAGAAPVVTNGAASVVVQPGPMVSQGSPQVQTQTQPSRPSLGPAQQNQPSGSTPSPSSKGQLVVEAAPGVTLSLDGSGIGQGSREMPPGTYTLTCSAGGLSATSRVSIRAGQPTPARCYAPSQVVRVAATSDDPSRPWMTIMVNGEANGQTPGQITLPPGRNTVFVRRRGFEVVGQDIATVDVPPRFTPDAPAPITLSFQFRAVNAP